MITKTVNPPFNPARLSQSLKNAVGDSGWFLKIGMDARSVNIEITDQLINSFSPGVSPAQAEANMNTLLNGVVSAHQTNFVSDELEDQKNRAYETIDSVSGEVSRRYVTDRTAQEITYQLKTQSAAKWEANGKPSTIDRLTYPGLYAEVMAFRAVQPNMSIQAVVDYINGTANDWYYKADQIEEARRKGKIQISFATTAMQVSDILSQTLNTLTQL